ncbi:MAG: LytTR family DNA-binding domain-containing protein [bacterium]|nr:LytTR family DNA-binding domain-containing protein [bacterium]
MKLKIAVCDDDPVQREYLQRIVSEWMKKSRNPAQIREYASAEAFLFDYAEEKDFDILLLDVEMPGISGTDLAKKVREDNSAVQIVFITGYYEYFGEGFDVSALHYLIKPVDEEKLFPVLDKAVRHLERNCRRVLISTGEGEIKIPLAEILYAEAQNVYTAVYTETGNYRTRMALGKFVNQLDDTFFRVHRSYVVNLKHIRKITRTEAAMMNGDLVPISRGMYDTLHAAVIKYL